MMLPSGQGFLCVTADQQFLIYVPVEHPEGGLNLILRTRLNGYNEEIADMKFLGEEEQYLAVATSVEHVRGYDLASMTCSYVLAGHTDIVLCLDTCMLSSGTALIVTGSKDNSAHRNLTREAIRKSLVNDAVSDLSEAHEVSPEDETIADVLREAKERLSEQGNERPSRGLVIEEITEEDTVSCNNHESSPSEISKPPQETSRCSTSPTENLREPLSTNLGYLEALKDDPESIRLFYVYTDVHMATTTHCISGSWQCNAYLLQATSNASQTHMMH